MKRVGRPPQVDINGEKITRVPLNVTVPTKLAEFLSRKEINRSKLFTAVVQQMYDDEICPKCFSIDVVKSQIGMRCKPCSRYKPYFYKYDSCPECNMQYKAGVNVPVGIKNTPDWGCANCQK